MNFPASVSTGLPSCTKTVTIRINGQSVKLKQNHDVVVDGQDISKLPYSVAGIDIRSVSSIFLIGNVWNCHCKLYVNVYIVTAKLPNGIEVWWDGLTRAYIDLPAEFKGKTKVS